MWVLRAVHEELQPYCRYGRGALPLRETDDLLSILGIDPEELEDVAEMIAARAGRSMDRPEENPYFGRVNTVGDLARFFLHQPGRIDA